MGCKAKKFISAGAVFATAVFFLWVAGKYALVCTAPFLISYLVSLAVRPASSFISRRFGVAWRFVSAFFVIILIVSIFLVSSWLIGVLIHEVESLSKFIGESLSGDDNVLKQVIEFFSGLREKIPFLSLSDDAAESVYGALSGALLDIVSAAASGAASVATSFVAALPHFLLGVVSALISTIYICTDKGRLRAETEAFLGKRGAESFFGIAAKFKRAVSSYLKSYLLLMLMTFAELFIGFIILGVENALLIALLVAIIDLLPVLGSGGVLLPWALAELFITGNTARGVGLLVLVAVMYLVRQFAEPHIVGTVAGVHPLLSLFAVYVGFTLFGFSGVIVFPILLFFIKAVATETEEEKRR